MSASAIFALCILAMLIVALIRDRMRPGIAMLTGSVIFLCAGILTPKEMLEGFSNKGMITVALLYLVSEGIRRSNILEKILHVLLPKKGKNVRKIQARMLPVVAGISAFLNNTPVVVIFAPMIKRWADKVGMPATKFLIPLSYATILGGMCTLIGTSTNLVVHGMIINTDYEGFTMFELGKVGVFIAIAGLIYIIVAGKWLLPDRSEEDAESAEDEAHTGRYHHYEVILSDRFPAIGKRINEIDFRRKFGASIMEVRRRGEVFIMKDMRGKRYKEGDSLLLMADDNFRKNWGDSSFFLLVSGNEGKEEKMSPLKRWISFTLLVLMVVGATVGEIPSVREAFPKVHLDMFFFASVVTVVMAWMNIFPARKYTKYISWDIVVTIASAFAISKAMINSGVADAIAEFAIGLTDSYGPYILLAVIFIITNLFTELMTNNAAAALAFPISLSIAQHLGVDPTPFFVTICMAASSSFCTPIGYQTNLIVQGVGGYKFIDFIRFGLPLNIISLIISVTLIPIFWPF